MINLKTEILVRVDEIMGILSEKVEGHPFVALLMRAQEAEGTTTPEMIHEDLLSGMPLRASENLLRRLVREEYFEEVDEGYQLTELGIENARDQGFWDRREGGYTIYRVFEFPFLPELPVKVEPAPVRSEKNKRGKDKLKRVDKGKLSGEFLAVSERKGKQPSIGKFQLDALQDVYYHHPDEKWDFHLQVAPDSELLGKLIKNSSPLRELNYPKSYNEVLDEVLSGAKEVDWDSGQRVVKVGFKADDLTFSRTVSIGKPVLRGYEFERTLISGVQHIPSDLNQAVLWYRALLVQKMKDYLFSEKDYESFAHSVGKAFLPHYPLGIYPLQELLKFLLSKNIHFYACAKITTPQDLAY